MAAPMVLRPRLLLVADDLALLYSREMMLGVKFDVQISGRLSEALKLLQERRFELLVVLGSSDGWHRLAGFARQQIPRPKILVVTDRDAQLWEDAGATICESHAPYDLLQACSQMFGLTSKSKAHGFSHRQLEKKAVAR